MRRVDIQLPEKVVEEADLFISTYSDRFESRTHFISLAIRAYFRQLRREGFFIAEKIKRGENDEQV